MTPVFQTQFGVPHGNCFAACVASILDVPLDGIPHVPVAGYQAFQEWLAPRGVQYLEVPRMVLTAGGDRLVICPADSHVILCGPSPNVAGAEHAVVGRLRAWFMGAAVPQAPGAPAGEWRIGLSWDVIHDPNPHGQPFDPSTVTAVGFFVRTRDST